ncbi:UDP-N-acetylmuramate dehydrogenase [Alcaligenaceae bacterium]|nr:UDP-N-acetylmuramate dehydrogenase [Alcaligenaceae bacterium]
MLHTSEQDLTAFNTLGLSARAHALVRFQSQEQLPSISTLAGDYSSIFVLGGGSNVVLAPQLDCLVIKVETRGIQLLEERPDAFIVEAQAGENWHEFVQHCVEKGWWGLENLALIPGTVGAAPVQNIGAYGVELDQRFDSLTAWDMQTQQLVHMRAQDCGFSYRNSVFKQSKPGRWLIVVVRFRLPKPWRPVLGYPDLQRYPGLVVDAAPPSAKQVFDAVCDIRRQKLPDPAVLGNAGSFFKNPIVSLETREGLLAAYPDMVSYPMEDGLHCKLAAGWMIDRAGWKGRSRGSMAVHDRQALVLVNKGGATAADVAALADAINIDIQNKFGVTLEQEPVTVS